MPFHRFLLNFHCLVGHLVIQESKVVWAANSWGIRAPHQIPGVKISSKTALPTNLSYTNRMRWILILFCLMVVCTLRKLGYFDITSANLEQIIINHVKQLFQKRKNRVF